MSNTLGSLPDNTEIARYMSFEKFFHLMHFQTAFFPSIKTLRSAPGSQGDALEGVWSPFDAMLVDGSSEKLDWLMNEVWPTVEKRTDETPRRAEPIAKPIKTPFGESMPDDYHADITKMADWIDVWCWNRFSHERIDMWRAYGAQPGSVMIRSTVGALKESLRLPAGVSSLVEDVVYSSRDGKTPRSKGEYSVFLQKSKAYESEVEIRTLLLNPTDDFRLETKRVGQAVGVDISKLVKEIIPHYDSPQWMVDAINAISEQAIGKGASTSSIRKEIEEVKRFRPWGR